MNAFRAANLAECRHYTEAISEYTIAINKYFKSKKLQFKQNTARWYLQRASAYMMINDDSHALADVFKASKFAEPRDDTFFNATIALFEYGKYHDAELILEKLLADSPFYSKEPFFRYLLAVAQQKQNKFSEAIANLKKAAQSFAFLGYANCVETCIEEVNKIEKTLSAAGKAFSADDLNKPRNDVGIAIKQIQTFVESKSFSELDSSRNASGPFLIGYSHNSNDSILTIVIKMDQCILTKNDISSFFVDKKAVTVDPVWQSSPNSFREAFQVPCGIIELVWMKGIFKQLNCVNLYSAKGVYPPQIVKIGKATIFDAYSYHMFQRYGEKIGDYKKALEEIEVFIVNDPKKYEPWIYKASYQSKLGKHREALESIEKAIKLKPADAYINPDIGDRTLLGKAEYLLALGRVDEAVKCFESGVSEKPNADQLLLRGKLRLAQGARDSALKDFRKAAKQFYEVGRIVKRDEADKLIAQNRRHR